ncbi:Protein BYPASS-related protein [Cucumis melo var. makuwa]|uniref:Protein BYPASS-related protein n=2 Tax=Cucumis melo TaxID=3656 RepID=A0A5D3CYI5_CUCMM|nr:Protein BYPASS-related protein [Cucumis melo var. makuwa]
MPATEYPGSFLGRISIRRNQVISMDGAHEQELEDLELFQKHVSERFSDLLPPPPSDDISPDALLSIAWLRKLLDEFLCCEAQFKALLIMGRDPSQIVKPPLDRLVPEFLDRVVKALDICNAVLHGIESVRQFQKLAEIAISALEQRPIGDGQVKRARRALNSLITSMAVEDKDFTNSKSTERAWSFGRRGGGIGTGTGTATPQHKDRVAGQFRSLSWSMAKGWSAAKQIQAMSSNLAAPRGGESSSLPQTVYLMSTVLVFVMWTLVAALPCQERGGLPTNLPVSKQMSWAQSMIGLQEKIAEEWKKKEKKGSAGLLEEMQKMEKLSQSLMEFTESFTFPLETEKAEEVAAQVAELSETCKKLEEGLVPLQQQIREVFHRVVKSRTEIVELLEYTSKASSPIV